MTVLLECTALKGTGKIGAVTPDKDGYYTVPLGAYDCRNSANMFYDKNSALKLLAPGSPLQRQIEKGVLYGELGHPKVDDYIDANGNFKKQAFFQRLYRVEEDRAAVHIRRVYVDPNFKDHEGNTICAVIGEVRPQGPQSLMVQQALQNPSSNCYFSVRSVTMDDRMRGIKYSKDIITWDFVIEGGIMIANKYDSPALESFESMSITPDILWEAIRIEDVRGTGTESKSGHFKTLMTSLNWNVGSKKEKPVWSKW